MIKKNQIILPLLFVGSLQSCYSGNNRVLYSATRTNAGVTQLTPGDSRSEVNYAGSLMIQNVETELISAGYSADLVAKVVAKANAEVSLAGNLAFGTFEEISLGLRSNSSNRNSFNISASDSNLTVGIAAEAVARGAVSALSTTNEKSLNEKLQEEGAFFSLSRYGLSSSINYLNEITGVRFRHDNRFTLAAGIPTFDTVGLIAKGQIKGLSAIKSLGGISNLNAEAIGNSTKQMTSTLFSASSQIGLVSESTAEELSGNMMRTIIVTVAGSELKEDAASVIAKIPESIDGFKELKLSASFLGETSKTMVKECVSGIKVADLQLDTQALVSKIVTASVSGSYQAANDTESVATATASAAKEAFLSYTALVSLSDVATSKEAAKAIFSTAISTFDSLPGWNIDVLSIVSRSLGSKALEAVKEVGFKGESGASVLSGISVAILDSAASMSSVKSLGVEQTTLKSSFIELSKATILDIQTNFPDATGNYTTVLDQAVDKVATNTTAPNTAPTIANIADQVTDEDIAKVLEVTISDAESTLTCATALTVLSSDSLVSKSGISIKGTAPKCLVSIKPTLNRSGSSTMTITVTDTLLTASDTFVLSVNPVNDAPTISDLDKQIIQQDGQLNNLKVTLDDVDSDTPDTPMCSHLTVSSSNQNLVKNTSISISEQSSYASSVNSQPRVCLVSLTPEPNQSGKAYITLTVTDVNDAEVSRTEKFQLEVQAPTIISVTDQSTNEDTALIGVPVSLSDIDTDLECRRFTAKASSSNPGLIPNSNITISGEYSSSGSSTKTVTFLSSQELSSQKPSVCIVNVKMSPLPNKFGASTITLEVIDLDKKLATLSRSFVLTVNPVNDSPTDLSISNTNLAENTGQNSVVGNLSANDPDTGDTFTYSLAAGTGSTDNASFNILGNQLRMTASADFETKSSYLIRIRATDQGGLYFEKQFTITITDGNEIPTLGTIAAQITTEDTALTLPLSASDLDGNLICSSTNFLYSSSDPFVVAATGAVSWSGTWPNCSAVITPVLNATGSSSISISVSDGTLTATQTFNLTVTSVNDLPLISDTANQVATEDIALETVTMSISDVETSLNCSDVVPTSYNTTLIPSENITFSGTAPNCFIRMVPAPNQYGTSTIALTVSDGSLTASDSFELTVNPVNDLPTDLSISSVNLYENAGANAVIGELSASDPDLGDIITYSLVPGEGSTDNASFDISGNQLLLRDSADIQTKLSYSILVRATDQGGLIFEKQLLIAKSNFNTAPILSAIANQTTNQGTSTSSIALTITDADGPTGICNSSYLSYTSQTTSVVAANDAMSWSGDWPNCAAVVTPVSDAMGSAVIAISVSDGSLLSSPQSFTLQVGSLPSGWYQESYLKASNAEANDSFGISVAISGDTAIVGAKNEDSNQTFITNGATSSDDNYLTSAGASYIYRRSESGWVQEAFVKASNADSGDYFGSSVSISGDTAIVGATGEASAEQTITNGTTSSLDDTAGGAGASYIYKKIGANWAQEAYIKASNAQSADLFGESVSISGDTAIVGVYREGSNQTTITNGETSSQDNSAPNAGASYIYKRVGSTWSQEAYIKASNAQDGDNFGLAVSVSGDTAIVGADGEDSNQSTITNGTIASTVNSSTGLSGASYIYRRVGKTWTQEAYVKASNNNGYDYFGSPVSISSFGSSVSISGDTAIVGAYKEASIQTTITNGPTSSTYFDSDSPGASYIYKRNGSSWVQEAYLKASNANLMDFFGSAISLSGNTAIVGAYGEDSNQTVITNGTTSSTDNTFSWSGASYIFRRNGNIWVQEAYLKASNANFNAYFGNAVSISGNTAIVGAFPEASNQTTITNGSTSSTDNSAQGAGAVYVYRNLSRIFDPDLRVSGKSTSSITISWGNNLGKATQVKIAPAVLVSAVLTSTNPTPPPPCTDTSAIDLGAGVTTYTYSELASGTKYGFRVCGFDGTNVSEGSVIWETTD